MFSLEESFYQIAGEVPSMRDAAYIGWALDNAYDYMLTYGDGFTEEDFEHMKNLRDTFRDMVPWESAESFEEFSHEE